MLTPQVNTSSASVGLHIGCLHKKKSRGVPVKRSHVKLTPCICRDNASMLARIRAGERVPVKLEDGQATLQGALKKYFHKLHALKIMCSSKRKAEGNGTPDSFNVACGGAAETDGSVPLSSFGRL